jgi:CheY-specific phosphatase CheX
MASSIGFYGDIDGMIVLVFPENIAKKACSLLLGESDEDKTIDEISDALGELVNIIGGRAKTLLSEKDIKANITLPRTFTKVEDVINTILDKKGVQIDLEFKDEPFSIFLTR